MKRLISAVFVTGILLSGWQQAEAVPLYKQSLPDKMILPLYVLNHLVQGGTPGQFDLYLLTQSWEAEFCYQNSEYKNACSGPAVTTRITLSLHGLWPEDNNGDYPYDCKGSEGCRNSSEDPCPAVKKLDSPV